jgi:hypothetical protein
MKLRLYDWQRTVKPKNDLIVQASSVDCDDGWRPWPIGMCWQYVFNHSKGESIQLGNHENLVLCAVIITTDGRRRPTGINRPTIVDTLSRNGIVNTHMHHDEYFNSLPTYKFVISPEGNGIDCHRHYEALLAGCIPIMEKNPLTEEKYKGCPILWTTDYSEITAEYLEKTYNEMLMQEYDFSALFLSTYSNQTQELIKEAGNFWLGRIAATRCKWY